MENKKYNDFNYLSTYTKYISFKCSGANLNNNKKALSLFLLTVFLFELFGYSSLFKIAQYKIHEVAEVHLKRSVLENEIQIITVSTAGAKTLDWEREGKEFQYQGEMYDVVRFETKDGFISYYCINDNLETKLLKCFDELLNILLSNDKSPLGKTAKRIIEMFSLSNCITIGDLVFVASCSKYSIYFNYSFYFVPVYREIFSPPPNKNV